MQQRGAAVYALMRMLSAVPTLLLVVVMAFLLMHAAPGGPFDEERALPPDTEANLARAYNLDAPLHEQLLSYLGGLVQGDFGPSYRYAGFSVAELIGAALPVSMLLGALSILVALAIGLPAGIAAAIRKDRLFDRLVTGIAMIGISVPVLIVAPLLVLVFAVSLGWLPAGWSGNPTAPALVLPVLALALPQIAYLTRLMRASMIEVLASDFIRTARAQGLKTSTIIRRHALKPALLPIFSYLGPSVAAVLTGSVVVEQIFGIPGLGQLFVRASLNRDYTVVLGATIVYASMVIILNMLVDIFYAWLDPRIRQA